MQAILFELPWRPHVASIEADATMPGLVPYPWSLASAITIMVVSKKNLEVESFMMRILSM